MATKYSTPTLVVNIKREFFADILAIPRRKDTEYRKIGDYWERRLKNVGKPPFDIVDVTEHGVIVRPHKSEVERKIPRDEIEDAFRRLSAVGELTRSDIREEFSNFNPAYVAAIFAKLPGVSHSLRPIRLWITGKS